MKSLELIASAFTWKTVFLIFVLQIFYFAFNRMKKLKIYPPGPIGLPILGYVPFLQKYSHLQFMELAKKYGDVFSLRLGVYLVVVLNSADAIREGFPKLEFNGRPQKNTFESLENRSPYFKSKNDVWSEHRRLFIHTIKVLGITDSRIEQVIKKEIKHLLLTLKSCKSEPTDLAATLSPTLYNILNVLLLGRRFDYDDPDTILRDEKNALILKQMSQSKKSVFLPWSKYVPFLSETRNMEEAKKAILDTMAITRKRMKLREDQLDPKQIRDYCDVYRLEMNSKREKKQDTTLSEANLLGSISDLFGAGGETTKNSLLWIVYTMAAYPAVQKRVQAEISDVVGPDRDATYTDIKAMPYTHACILEVMRWKPAVALPILHDTTTDTTLRGFHIPKGTIVMANLWNALHDPERWSQPDDFKPDRFLSEDGLSVHKLPDFMPFSVGKRACPGELLASMELFLYLVFILQAFDLSFPEGVEPTFEDELGLHYMCKPFLLHFTPRVEEE